MNASAPLANAPVKEFDHHGCPGIATDPFRAFEGYRDEPIFWTPAHGGFWVPTRYDDIRAVLRDADTFSSRTTAIPAFGWPRPLIPIELDPPEHGKFRSLLARTLSGSAGDAVLDGIERECARLVADLVHRGSCDVVADYAVPLQNALFAILFGDPDEPVDRWATWSAGLSEAAGPERQMAAMQEITVYLAGKLAERKAAPPVADPKRLLDVLAHAEVDGRPLSDEEMLDAAFVMFLGNFFTLSSSMGFGFLHLAGNRDLRAQLVANPEITGTVVNELLRLYSVINCVRTATRDTVVAGVSVAAGDRLLLCLSFADRDPDVYPDPTEFRLDRPPGPGNLAFGHGPHRCLGARIAGHVLIMALKEWHRHIADYEVAEQSAVRAGGGTVLTLNAVPLRWRAG